MVGTGHDATPYIIVRFASPVRNLSGGSAAGRKQSESTNAARRLTFAEQTSIRWIADVAGLRARQSDINCARN